MVSGGGTTSRPPSPSNSFQFEICTICANLHVIQCGNLSLPQIVFSLKYLRAICQGKQSHLWNSPLLKICSQLQKFSSSSSSSKCLCNAFKGRLCSFCEFLKKYHQSNTNKDLCVATLHILGRLYMQLSTQPKTCRSSHPLLNPSHKPYHQEYNGSSLWGASHR